MIRQRAAQLPESALARLAQASPGHEARHLGAALEQQDTLAWDILRSTAEDLAFGLSHAVHLFHPDIVVLGGGLSLLGEPWRVAVAQALPRHVMGVFRDGLDVRLALLGEDAVPCGALICAATRGGSMD
jgi:glucokinase